MIDLYLRFTYQAEATAVLQPLGMTYTDNDGVEQISQGNHQFALWQVGWLDDAAGAPGWCINIRQIDMEMDLSSLTPYQVYPPNPQCVWS